MTGLFMNFVMRGADSTIFCMPKKPCRASQNSSIFSLRARAKKRLTSIVKARIGLSLVWS